MLCPNYSFLFSLEGWEVILELWTWPTFSSLLHYMLYSLLIQIIAQFGHIHKQIPYESLFLASFLLNNNLHCVCVLLHRRGEEMTQHSHCPIVSPSQLSLVPASILFSKEVKFTISSWHLRIRSPKDFPSRSVDKNPPPGKRHWFSPSLGRLHTPQST